MKWHDRFDWRLRGVGITKEWADKIGNLVQADASEQSHVKHLRRHPSWQEIQAAVESEKGERWEAFADRHGDWGRDIALAAARRLTPLTNRELAECLGGIDDSAVAQAVRRIKARESQNNSLRETLQKVLDRLSSHHRP